MNFWVTSLLICKLAIGVGIVVFLLAPTNIYRQDLVVKKNNLYQMKRQLFHFKAEHLFCSKPHYMTTKKNGDDENGEKMKIWNSLNVPVNSEMSESLLQFGECLSNSTKSPVQDENPCMCNSNPGYIILICICFISMAISLTQLFGAKFFDSHEASFAFFGCLVWLGTICVATIYHIYWNDQIWTPETLYSQNYFRKPVEWTSAIVLAVVYFFLTLIEFMCLDPMRYADDENGMESISGGRHGRSYKRALRRLIIFYELQTEPIGSCQDLWKFRMKRNLNKQRYRNRRTPITKVSFFKTYP